MTTEVLKLIAQLCLMPNGGDSWSVAPYIHGHQLACQKYYVTCSRRGKTIEQCILDKNPASDWGKP
jgi:hypothetical protein